MSRRLLLLCYFYPPLGGGGVHRVLGFTRHLPACGWACTVVCAGAEDYWVRDDTLDVPEGTEVIRVAGGSGLAAWLRWTRRPAGAPGRRSGPGFARLRRWSDWWLLPDSYAGWARRAGQAAARRLERGDIAALLSSSPPESVHLAGLDLARRFRVPWVADFRDPWVTLRFRDPPTAWHRARQEALERRVLRGADLVVAASRTHERQLRALLGEPAAARVEHLPNGFEPFPPAAPPAPREADRFVVAFTGTLAQMPDAEVFLEAVHEVLARIPEARRRLRVKFAGPYETGIEDRALALGLRGIVEFLGPRPHDETRALQREARLLALWKPRGPGYRTMVPGKLYEYLDAGRPVLAALEADDEAAELVRRAGGEVVPPGGREGMAASIERRYVAWREGARQAVERPTWLEDHARARLAARLAASLDRLPGISGGPARAAR